MAEKKAARLAEAARAEMAAAKQGIVAVQEGETLAFSHQLQQPPQELQSAASRAEARASPWNAAAVTTAATTTVTDAATTTATSAAGAATAGEAAVQAVEEKAVRMADQASTPLVVADAASRRDVDELAKKALDEAQQLVILATTLAENKSVDENSATSSTVDGEAKYDSLCLFVCLEPLFVCMS